MVAVTVDVAAALLSRRSVNDEGTLGTLLFSLRRSLAQEAIDEQMWEDLEAVLGEYALPAPPAVTVIAKRFRTATTTLVEIVPYLVRPYPVEEMRHLIYVSTEHPHPENARGHVNRFAMAILAVLDLMGDEGV
ncbi:DUF6415 family natural product biosynthesis protein [Streptomyces aurantiogriseus]|uniref:Uncharacterized protein n=1 Tax=Streptomyces aurantiogriseus TaxID=66870 RepID=A0A918FFK8_9ACTN|nr:DUF6415 family natural product biosynthesis protein [Streptomyces aurantiogriseus]GGR34845.1 hypothetical protein GCM10010251_58840 [Streptomyces aurantiogriseus]